jgi:hypothetical protein
METDGEHVDKDVRHDRAGSIGQGFGRDDVERRPAKSQGDIGRPRRMRDA